MSGVSPVGRNGREHSTGAWVFMRKPENPWSRADGRTSSVMGGCGLFDRSPKVGSRAFLQPRMQMQFLKGLNASWAGLAVVALAVLTVIPQELSAQYNTSTFTTIRWKPMRSRIWRG
jgi:hypothetical protein